MKSSIQIQLTYLWSCSKQMDSESFICVTLLNAWNTFVMDYSDERWPFMSDEAVWMEFNKLI